MAAIVVRPLPRSLDAILLGHSHLSTRVEFVAGPATGQTLDVSGGQVVVDMAGDVRRTGDLTVPSLPQWRPDGPTHPLDPRSGSQLQVWLGVTDDDGVTREWSQGIFLVSRVGFGEGPGGEVVKVDLVDRAHRIKRAGIRRRWAASGTDRVLASVVSAIKEVAPWARVDIDLDGDIPFGTDSVIAEYGGDVWSKCRALARTMSRDLHVDRDGVVVAPLLVDPLNAEPVPLLGLTARSIDLDSSDVVNVVGCPWEEARPDDAPEGWTPKGGVSEWVDTVSSTSISSPFGVAVGVCGGDTSVVHTPEHAALAAQADGITRLGLQQAAAGSKVPDPRDDVGVPVDVDGTTHIVSRLTIDLSGGPTQVDLGASQPDIADMMAAMTRPVGEYSTTEIVTGLSPLRSKSITDPSGVEVAVEWTDALTGTVVGDTITVQHKGAGRRVGVALLVKKPLAVKFEGEKFAIVGGADLTVGGDLALRARIGNGAFSTFHEGDVSLNLPDHTHNTNFLLGSVNTSGLPGSVSILGNAGSSTTGPYYAWTASNEDRARINGLVERVAWLVDVVLEMAGVINSAGGSNTSTSAGGATAPGPPPTTEPPPTPPPPTPVPITTIVVSPHPDDETLRLSGYISAAAARGDTMKLIAVTDGGASGAKPPSWTVEQLKTVRRGEQNAAWSALTNGTGTVIRLGQNDGSVSAASTKTAINSAISSSSGRVEVYAAAYFDDAHPDHRAVASAVNSCSATVRRYSLAADDDRSGTTYSPASMSDAQTAYEAYRPFGWTSVRSSFAALKERGFKSRVRAS